jgi:hypothetical protein
MILEDEDPVGENSDLGNPVIWEIFFCHMPTLSFIPIRAIREVGAAFAVACELAALGGWALICAFTKAPPKDGLGDQKYCY